MKAYVFPGQGSQVKGMGGDLFDHYQDKVAQADKILGYSIKELCLNDPQNQLAQTQYTQPALFVVSALTYLKKVEESGTKPDYVAGHSLGEYSALFAANVFDFETGLKIVQYRGQLMSNARGGSMAAVIGLKADQIEKVLKENSLTTLDMANLNTPSQTVISGPKQDIDAAKAVFERSGAMMYVPLNVSGAFHSRYMQEAKNSFSSFIGQFEFSEPKIKVIANVNALPYEKSKTRENLGEQMVSSVQWVKSVQYLMDQGVSEFEEVGPGKVLIGLVQKIQRELKA